MSDNSVTYAGAGVDIDAAQRALFGVSADIAATHNASVIGGVGGFGGLFNATFQDLDHPVLVSSIDGIGTKTKVAAMVGKYDGLGHDIVNHCVNDILCQGARPLFFLDYYGCSHLNGPVFEEVVRGMAYACSSLGVALIGGETAEMPGVYTDGEIDVVGAVVGVVDFDRRLPRSTVQNGDLVIGLAASGLHTNGFTMARKALFEIAGLSARDELPGLALPLGEELLRPHRCYYNAVYPLLIQESGVKALAHITGGGLYDNIPRVLPSEKQVVIDSRSWNVPPIFKLIQDAAQVADAEMNRTFNMGIGMVLIVDSDASGSILQSLEEAGEWATVIGTVQSGSHDVQIV